MKKVLALLLALVMTLALSACGGGGNDTPAPADNTPANNTDAPANNDAPATPAPSGDKIDINVIAAQYGQNTTQWWADFQNEFNSRPYRKAKPHSTSPVVPPSPALYLFVLTKTVRVQSGNPQH